MPLIELDSETEEVIYQSVKDFKGQSTTLESALGAIAIGQLMGWRVLKMIHNPSTYRKYENILGIKFRDLCPERTTLSKKSIGLNAADKLQSFWAVVRGKEEVPNKGMLSES